MEVHQKIMEEKENTYKLSQIQKIETRSYKIKYYVLGLHTMMSGKNLSMSEAD